MKRRQHAFTLLEVLIALAMLAIVLTAAFRGINLVALRTAELSERYIAEWIAQDRLAELRMQNSRGQFPDVGGTDGDIEQGGRRFHWHIDVRALDLPLFRRIDVKVSNNDGVVLARLIGIASRS
ncbi:MAG: type secretion system protein GspI [Rhodocyclales bacterium]|nr:type secretion system protein GspI [Rhodocyclales bacterium]MDB5887996.1 type secretion system protein GspI [Rhodocyclales bacterium]